VLAQSNNKRRIPANNAKKQKRKVMGKISSLGLVKLKKFIAGLRKCNSNIRSGEDKMVRNGNIEPTLKISTKDTKIIRIMRSKNCRIRRDSKWLIKSLIAAKLELLIFIDTLIIMLNKRYFF
jgi:hypothetical protein